MLNISLTDFISLLTGVKAIVTADNVGTPQCVDPIQLYARILGAPRFTGNACDIINQAGNNFTQIVNTPTNFPSVGDIVVWSNSYNGVGGHVGIATGEINVNTFQVFNQNNPDGSDCEVGTYNYVDVLGWLHPKEAVLTASTATSTKAESFIQHVSQFFNGGE